MPLDSMPKPSKTNNTKENIPVLSSHSAKLAQLTQQLCELIIQETSLLKKRLPREAQRLHGTKSRLMAEYRDVMNKLQVNENLLGPKDSAARKYLRKLTDALRDALRDHARILLRLKAVTEGIIKSVGDEVIKKDRPVVSYGKNASYQPVSGARPTSLQINQVI